MSISFSTIELINIAIGIERMGIAFYDVMTRSTENAVTRDVFQYLANMEREHIQIFQGMLAEADKYQIPETYTDEHASYLQALVDGAVAVAEERGYQWANVAGTSAGAIVAALFSTMMEAHDTRYIKDEQFIRTIPIPTLGVGTTEFDISRERSEALYQSGREAAEKFFDTWNFSKYIDRYRGGKPRIDRRLRLKSG